MTKTPRFQHRFVVVTETQHVVKPARFSYRSYAVRADASHAAGKVSRSNIPFRWSYVVDQQNPGNVILP